MKRVQKRDSKMMGELEKMPYKGRVKPLIQVNLSKRTSRTDLFTVLKHLPREKIPTTKRPLIYYTKAEQELKQETGKFILEIRTTFSP